MKQNNKSLSLSDKIFPSVNTLGFKPILKWTGGKYREFSKFSDLLPDFIEHHIEPFAGGCGVMFAMNGNNRCSLNDASSDLIGFYNSIKCRKNEKEFLELGKNWQDITVFSEDVFDVILPYYTNDDDISLLDIGRVPSCWDDAANEYVKASIKDKIKRIRRIVLKEKDKGVSLTKEALFNHTETGLRAGFYNYFRAIVNKKVKSEISQVVAWFMVREYCYASMFRFSKNGDFNIPYGGISYNSKDILKKIKLMHSDEMNAFLENKSFQNNDFEVFLNGLTLTSDSFIFLDPPYDSTFSTYDNKTFGKDDHIRLSNLLSKVSSKWLMVINYNDFIDETYGSIAGVNKTFFDKKYMNNMKNRGNRDAVHVVYRNY